MIDKLLRIAKEKAFIPEKDQKRMSWYGLKMGYLEKRGDHFHITNKGRERLKKGNPCYLDKKAAKARHEEIVSILKDAADQGFYSSQETIRIIAYCKKQGFLETYDLSCYDYDDKKLIRQFCYFITDIGIKYLKSHKIDVYSSKYKCFISEIDFNG